MADTKETWHFGKLMSFATILRSEKWIKMVFIDSDDDTNNLKKRIVQLTAFLSENEHHYVKFERAKNGYSYAYWDTKAILISEAWLTEVWDVADCATITD